MNMHSKNIALPSTVQSLVAGKIVETKSMLALHAFLGVKTKPSTWIKRRCQGWVNGVDFIIGPTIGSNKQGPIPEPDRFCSIRMAGHIGLQEHNEGGKKLRDHCLEIVGKWNAGAARQETPEQLMARALEQAAKTLTQKDAVIVEKDNRLKIVEPKAAVADRIAESEGDICVRQAAKILKKNGLKIDGKSVGQNNLIVWLLRIGWFYRDNRNGKLHAGASWCEKGYVCEVPHVYQDKETGADKVEDQPRITGRGMARITALLNAEQGASLC